MRVRPLLGGLERWRALDYPLMSRAEAGALSSMQAEPSGE